MFGGLEVELDPQPGLAHEGQAYLGKSGDERHHEVVVNKVDAGEGDGEVAGGDEGEGEGEAANAGEPRCAMMAQPARCLPMVWCLKVILAFMISQTGTRNSALTSPLLIMILNFLNCHMPEISTVLGRS